MTITGTILIIDDEVQIRRLLEITLSANGYKISEASTGKEGINLAASLQPLLIILDFGLPDMDGLDIIKKLHCNAIKICTRICIINILIT